MCSGVFRPLGRLVAKFNVQESYALWRFWNKSENSPGLQNQISWWVLCGALSDIVNRVSLIISWLQLLNHILLQALTYQYFCPRGLGAFGQHYESANLVAQVEVHGHNSDEKNGKGPYLYDVHTGWGGGFPKSRGKEQIQLISLHDKGGGTVV